MTMKKILSNIYTLAALLMAGAAFTACSSSDDIIEQPAKPTEPQVYTLVIKASKGDNASTRALSLSGSTLNAYWSGTEKIDVLQDGVKIGTATAAASSNGNTTITAKLTSAPVTTKDLNFYLGGSTIDFTGQVGLLTGTNSISEKFDYANDRLADNSYTVNGNNVTPKEYTDPLVFGATEQAIIKFTLQDKANNAAISPSALSVTDGTSTVELTSIPTTTYTANGAGVLYVAFPPSGEKKTITLTATVGSDTYTYTTSSPKTFYRGWYYEITVKMEKAYVNLSALTSNYTAQDGDVLKGTLGSAYAITIADDATVTLSGVTVGDASSSHAGIVCGGAATIILAEGTTNSVTGGNTNAGIQAGGNGKTLTINGSGSLTANGGKNNSYGGAGIGSNGNLNTCGNIVIEGGNIKAAGGPGAAGIGAGSNSNCGIISISGGTITATGGLYAAGIGGSAGNSSTVGACDDISITGGTIDATGGNSSAGIGGGFWCGDITITSGVIRVTSTAGSSAPNSIGGGGGSGTHCGTVTIGSTVGAISKSPFTYPVTGHVLTSAVVGDIICSDGLAYAATDKDYLPSGVTAVAMIAYLGSASDCTNGLAIAMKDVSENMLSWNNSRSQNADMTAAEWCDAWNTSKPIKGGTWRLPSIKDWQYMFIGCGSYGSYSDHPSSMEYLPFASKLSSANGTALQPTYYWASTESSPGSAWYHSVSDGNYAYFNVDSNESNPAYVRACLAF